MDRRDGIVAGVGAVLVALAIVGASLGGPGETPYTLTYVVASTATDLPGTPGGGGVSFALKVPDNATHLSATVTLSVTGVFAPTASAHVELVSPDGSRTTKDAAPSPGGSTMTAILEADLAPAPANETIRAGSLAEAEARLARNATAGTWTVVVTFSSGTPAPQGVRIAAKGEVESWTGRAAPESPGGR